MINGLLSLLINGIFDIKDAMHAKGVTDIKSNVVELVCVCTDDLPIDLTSQYCKSLEVVYATLLRASLQSLIRNRGNSSPKDIFKSLPILTNFDQVQFNKELGTISSLSDSLFSNKKGEAGSAAVSAFLEHVKHGIESVDVKFNCGLESGDVFLKETRGGVPTFIEAIVTITTPGGKAMDKVIPIGVSVRPKVVSPQEVIGFFIKQNNKLVELTQNEKVRAKRFSFKSLLSSNRIKQDATAKLSSNEKRTLNNILESTKDINKPFVCLLISSYTKDMLLDANVDITKPALLKQIYNSLPIMSIAIYDMNVDMINYSLLRDTVFTAATASSFNTDISQLQKTLAEGLRVSKMLG
ncbi:MAG: hypothetical protein ACRCX2_24925 [Paraclostridium sp.]